MTNPMSRPTPAAVNALLATHEASIPTAVYRFFDADGRLLYVGMTNNLRSRWTAHAAEKPWWPEVASQSATWFGTRTEAAAAESAALKTENPVHNVHSTPRHGENLSHAIKAKRERMRRANEDQGQDAWHVIVTREGRDWLAEVQSIQEGAATYARTLKGLDKNVREVIVLGADLPDDAMDDLNVEYEYRIDEDDKQRRAAVATRREARRLAEKAERETSILACRYVERGVPVRDVAAMLDISHQRVSQLASSITKATLGKKPTRGIDATSSRGSDSRSRASS
jgi:hypothetical protein